MSFKKTTLLLIGMIIASAVQAKDYQITDFGAKGDGVFLNSRIIQRAIDYVSEHGGGRIVFTSGKFLTGTVYLKSNVTLHIEKDATILGSTNPFDYIHDPYIQWTSLIYALKQENVGVTGSGTIDGQGFTTSYKMCEYVNLGIVEDPMKLDRPHESKRHQNIYFRECRNTTVKDVTLRNPGGWNETYDQCTNVLVEGITVDSKSYWNNDGIDVVDCDSVIIRNCFIDAADDVFCFKSHSAKHICQNVLLENCVGRSSANGIKFGTMSLGGFKNFVIRNVKIYDTFRSAITFASVDGGAIENILVDSITSINTGNVIFLRTGLRHNGDRIGYMRNIHIKNVKADVPLTKPDAGYSYEGPVEDLPRNISPASIVGIPDIPIENVTIENVEITYPGGGNPNYAYRGTSPAELDSIPEMISYYPEFSQFKELPAWAFYIRHAKGITLKNITFNAKEKDYRPAIVTNDVKGLKLQNVKINEPDSKKKNQIIKYKTK